MLRTFSPIVLLGALALACAGDGKSGSKSAHDASGEESAPVEHASDNAEASEHADAHGDSEGEPPKSTGDKPAPEPEFKEGMSVDEATKAVPDGLERRNIDQETLGKPLQDVSIYEPCKPGSTRVKIRVAVWDGRAVGIDVTTSPKNEKLASCVKEKIAGLKWDKKVKSLNQIEFQL